MDSDYTTQISICDALSLYCDARSYRSTQHVLSTRLVNTPHLCYGTIYVLLHFLLFIISYICRQLIHRSLSITFTPPSHSSQFFGRSTFSSLIMSLEGCQSPLGPPLHDRSQLNPSPIETDRRPSTHDSNSATDSMVLDHVNGAALAAPYQEEVASPMSPTPGSLEKENSPHSGASPAVEEPLEVRLERLGRQRPEVFSSAWAEIGFVFSISMSQVLSVIFRPISLLEPRTDIQ